MMTSASDTQTNLALLNETHEADEIFDEPDDNVPVLLLPSFLDWREVSTWQ